MKLTQICAVFLLGLPVILFASPAHSIEITWINPTEYDNGEALTLQEFSRFDFACGEPLEIVATWIDIEATQRMLDIGMFARGVEHTCALRVAVVGPKTGGQITPSNWSNAVSFTLPFLTPKAPILESIDASL
jgi:hypothetical protein